MYTIFNTSLIHTQCPQNMTEGTCPLRQFIDKGQDLFHVSMNETHLMPNEYNSEKFMRTYSQMLAICNKCKADNSKVK